jgi:hypothetical protein
VATCFLRQYFALTQINDAPRSLRDTTTSLLHNVATTQAEEKTAAMSPGHDLPQRLLKGPHDDT